MSELSPTAPEPARRTFLRRVVRGGAALALLGSCGTLAAIRSSGYSVDPARASVLKTCAPWQLVVLDAIAARMCLADVPYDAKGAPPTPREVGVSEFVDAFLAEAPAPVRRDFLALVGAVEHAYPLLCGHRRRFSALPTDQQDRVLTQMETSSVGLVRGAFAGLKSLLMMGYWRDPRTWGVIGYDGPLVNRPDSGWVPAKYLVRAEKM